MKSNSYQNIFDPDDDHDVRHMYESIEAQLCSLFICNLHIRF